MPRNKKTRSQNSEARRRAAAPITPSNNPITDNSHVIVVDNQVSTSINPWNNHPNDAAISSTKTVSTDELFHSFPQYADMKLGHVFYCQLRILNLFKISKRSEMSLRDFSHQFWEIYHENFFRFDVLRHFVADANKERSVEQFIDSFCSHFLKHDDKTVSLEGAITEIYLTTYNGFCDILQDIIDFRVTPNSFEPTPSEIRMFNGNFHNINVAGRRHALNFNDITENIRGCQPTMKEVGERIKLIIKRVARHGDAVNHTVVTKEICTYYSVPNISKLNLKGPSGRPVTLERDIPEMNNLMRTHAMVISYLSFKSVAFNFISFSC